MRRELATPRATLHDARRERKLRVDAAEADLLQAEVATQLPARPRFSGELETRVRCQYFDFEEYSLTRRCLASPDDNVKVRSRQYERVGGHGPAPDTVWLEVKQRSGELVGKERAPAPPAAVPAILARREAPPAGASRLGSLLAHGQLWPILVVVYRRVAFEGASGRLRLTIDRGITFAPLDRPHRGGHHELGECVVEVKWIGELPRWVEQVLSTRRTSQASKFDSAIRALGMP